MKRSNSILKSCIGLFACTLACTAAAQTFDDEYHPFAEYEEPQPALVPDSALFYRAVQQTADLYSANSRFVLPPVAMRRRGQPSDMQTATLDGSGIPYRAHSILRTLGAEEHTAAGAAMTRERIGTAGGLRTFDFASSSPLLPYRASISFSGRNYLAGAKFSATGQWFGGWDCWAALDLRAGRDLYTNGVFTNALTLGWRCEKHFGENHRLACTAIVPLSMRGTRLSSTEEAFALTGDRLYNPAWGYQNGKVRNSRIRREVVPWAAVAYRGALSPATEVAVALNVQAGVQKYSSLGWYDARTPMPDNYRYLPSFTADSDTEQAWRSNDPRYTQIDWDALIAVNRMADGHAVYALEDRVEQLCDMQANATFTSRPEARLTLDYGFYAERTSTRNYKRMRDLLGARHVTDIDQYLVDDATYGNRLENDLRHPGRKIGPGDRFGYDYTLARLQAGARLRASWRTDRFRADGAIEIGGSTTHRRGRMEKELFPGDRSYGRSRSIRTATCLFKALAGWAFSPRSYIELTAAAGKLPPDPEALFYQPLYNNRIVDRTEPEQLYAAELNFRQTGRNVDFECTAFATGTFDELETHRYFDDPQGVYCDMAIAGIGRLACGVEAAATIRLGYRWRLTLAASAGRYVYVRNPRVTVISDTDNAPIDTDAESHMGGCRIGGAPQLTGCGEIIYFGPKGWGCRLSAGYAGIRYVEPAILRRTARIARQSGTVAEDFALFTHQERLPDAFTADCSIFKSFYIGRSRLTASLLVHNLPGMRETPYNGYESLRIRRITAGDTVFWRPHATRYTYAYGRTFHITVSYAF